MRDKERYLGERLDDHYGLVGVRHFPWMGAADFSSVVALLGAHERHYGCYWE